MLPTSALAAILLLLPAQPSAGILSAPSAAAPAASDPGPQRGSRAAAGDRGRRNSDGSVWYSNPGSRGQPGPADRLAGAVGWRASPRLLALYEQSGFGAGTYRQTLKLHVSGESGYIGADFAEAVGRGRTTWLTCVGTPAALSPHPEQTGNEYGTGLPEFARYPPTDAVAWADEVLEFIAAMEAGHGVAPAYVELWNEPERPEWFTGSSAEFLDFYAAAAGRLRSARPDLRIGGPGLAGARSPLDGSESLLLALVRRAASSAAPLDFVSWHHYAPGSELLYTQMVAQLRELGTALGLAPFETAVSEWNIFPSAQGAVGPEFDGSHAAANYAAFIATGALLGLDRNCFFLDLDEGDEPGISDLTGTGLGMMTHHGVKKPVRHVSEIMLGMARERAIGVIHPPDEFSVRVAASKANGRVRYVFSNDVVTGLWVFANRSRENGMDPGWLHPLWLAAGGSNATEASLMAEGLTRAQAQAVLGFIPEVLRADRYTREARPVTLVLSGRAAVRLGEVRRFSATVNAPAAQREAVLPELEAAESHARLLAAEAAAACLVARGYSYSAADILAIEADFLAWAAAEGIAYGDAVIANRLLNETLRDARLADEAALNALPELRLRVETAAQAGVSLNSRTITFSLEPDSAIVVDVLL